MLAGVIINARRSRDHVDKVTAEQTNALGAHLTEVTRKQTVHLEKKIEAATNGTDQDVLPI